MSREYTSATVTRVISPDEIVEKQLRALTSVGRANYLVGIANPKADPIEAGSSPESEATFNASMQIALSGEHRRKGVAKSNMQEWFTMAKEIGADKLVSGVTKRRTKVTDFWRNWHPELTSHLATIDAMPKSTLDDRIAKMDANARGLNARRGQA